MMYWDVGMLTIPMRLLKAKLNLFYHISCLPDSALSRSILDVQQRLHLPGLHEEVAGFLTKHQVHDIRQFNKNDWKSFLKLKIKEENRNHIIQWSESYKKIDSLSLACEDYGIKPYLNELRLAEARLKFRERSSCMKYCRTHASSDNDNIKAMFQCYHCSNIDVLSHWRTCDAYSNFRQSKNLDSDDDLINYYQEIIQLRAADLEK